MNLDLNQKRPQSMSRNDGDQVTVDAVVANEGAAVTPREAVRIVHKFTRAAQVGPESWEIRLSGADGEAVIGTGATWADAWKDAAGRLRGIGDGAAEPKSATSI